ncbi:MAG TPA: hypothetical protein DD381_07465 [Lentisphaeria bacterium]|nr:MAG: hypothetical protein A2X47_04045 [Lentisphaerae bacterium GWF2_38_69]HBM16160.1 hypothetical protein [Lentisphaeria bacterium]
MRSFLLIFISCLVLSYSLSAESSDDKASQKGYMSDYTSEIYLYNVVRYLYRWYLDEIDIEKNTSAKDIEFFIRKLNPELDKDDRSLYAEIIIPMFNISVKLKKSDYIIEETGQEIKSNGFKIINVSRISTENFDFTDYSRTTIEIEKMREYLFKTRNHEEYPSEDLLDKIRKSFKNQIVKLQKEYPNESFNKNTVLFLAPMSPIGNDFWAYWENGKLAFHCNADIDISNEKIWDNENFYFDYYDVYKNTVVSLSETALSNEFLTRDQVGRILFNCMVLGKRVTMQEE